MNVLTAAIILFVMTISTGVIAFFIVHHSYEIRDNQSSILDMNDSITGIEDKSMDDDATNSGNFLTVAQAILANKQQSDRDKVTIDQNTSDIKSSSEALKKNVQSSRLSLTTPTTSTNGDYLSVSTTPPTKSTHAPTDGTQWMQVTDKDSTNYGNLGVGSMWADKGISMAQGACIDFGIGGGTLCGPQLSMTGATIAEKKNFINSSYQTTIPGDKTSLGKNRIVGDTMLTGDVLVGGNMSLGNSATGAVGVGMLSTKTGSHIYSGIDDTLPESSMTMGFTHKPADGTLPRVGADVVQMKKSKTGNHVRILGSLDVCDEEGKNCTPVGVRTGTTTPFVDTGRYADWYS